MSISRMIIYSSSLVAIIAAVAGYLAYSSFFQLEAAMQSGGIWQEEMGQLRRIILVTCGSIFVIAVVCGQFIARFLTNSLNELYQMAQTIEMDSSGNTSLNNPTTDNRFDGLLSALEQSKTISRQKKELQSLNDMLQLRNDSLDSLVYRVSHDLKAPVINLKSLLGILQKKLADHPDAVLTQSISMADGATEKLKQTITDLLEVARIEKHIRQSKEWNSLTEIIESVRAENNQEILKHNINFQIDLTGSDQVFFSKCNLNSILSNLINNSIKYHSPDRPSLIHIATKKEKDSIILTIEDNGIGMDLQKNKAKLFTMFSRFHDHVEGSGVGLYIVKKLVEEGNGELSIESTPNVGTRIEIQFPDQVKQSDTILSQAL